MSASDPNDEPLTPLHPDHRKVLMIEGAIAAAPLLLGALVLEAVDFAPLAIFAVPAVLIAAWLVLFAPARRYRRKGYRMDKARLRIVRGWLFRRDTVVPFGRVQHIDVNRGPLQRPFDLATLVVHTAGTHNSSVALPGLKHADAMAMREAIRAHISHENEGG